MQAGSYLMKTQMTAIDALRAADQPRQLADWSKFTVPGGLRLSAQVDALVKGTKIKKASYHAALKQPKTLGLPKYAKNVLRASCSPTPTS